MLLQLHAKLLAKGMTTYEDLPPRPLFSTLALAFNPTRPPQRPPPSSPRPHPSYEYFQQEANAETCSPHEMMRDCIGGLSALVRHYGHRLRRVAPALPPPAT